MRNTTALIAILAGGMLMYAGYRNLSFADTIRFFTGGKIQGNTQGQSGGSSLLNKDLTPPRLQPGEIPPESIPGFTPAPQPGLQIPAPFGGYTPPAAPLQAPFNPMTPR